jgi:hypothetical protein
LTVYPGYADPGLLRTLRSAHGNKTRARTPMASSVRSFPKAPTSVRSATIGLNGFYTCSMNGLEKCATEKHPLRLSRTWCIRGLRPPVDAGTGLEVPETALTICIGRAAGRFFGLFGWKPRHDKAAKKAVVGDHPDSAVSRARFLLTMILARTNPISNRNQMGSASRVCEITSGGVRKAPMTKAPTMT